MYTQTDTTPEIISGTTNLKPDKVPWFGMYIADPLQGVWYAVTRRVTTLYHKLIGAWYCEYCHKYHGRRVYKYKILRTNIDEIRCGCGSTEPVEPKTVMGMSFGMHRYVCSLGADAIHNGEFDLD